MSNTYPDRLVDGHIHIFPEKMMQAVFNFFEKTYSWKLPFTTNPDALLDVLVDQGVEKAFTLAYTHKPGLSRELNHWLAEYCFCKACLYPFGAIHPQDPDFEKVITECLDQYKFPGMKLHCLVQRIRPDDSKLFPLYEAIAERSKGIIIHAGSFPQPSTKHLGIEYVANLLKEFPGLNLIIPHLGLNDLPAYSELLQTYEGLFLDTAFVFQNKSILIPLAEVKNIILAYPEKIIYGSDFPFILEPPRNGLERILSLDLPREVQENLFFKNAMRFLDRLG